MYSNVEYKYLRPKKAMDLQHLHNLFDKKENLTAISYKKAVILPLKRFPNDGKLFGRGG
jgi:hypothetical protein